MLPIKNDLYGDIGVFFGVYYLVFPLCYLCALKILYTKNTKEVKYHW